MNFTYIPEGLVNMKCPSARLFRVSLVVQMANNMAAVSETWVRSPGQEDPLENRMDTYSSILA